MQSEIHEGSIRGLLKATHSFAQYFEDTEERSLEDSHLRNELSVGLRHGEGAEELLEIVWQIGSARVARIHCDEDADVRVDVQPLADQVDAHLSASANCFLNDLVVF